MGFMKLDARRVILVALLFALAAPAGARKRSTGHKPPPASKSKPDQVEAATRLQIFLDRANFSPGVITGRYDDFTFKALSLYRQSRGGPAFIDYSVTDADLKSIGPMPANVAAQAKLKFLPYRDAAEAIAERFHCDIRFLKGLNPGKTFKAGDQLKVPNVEPFDLDAVKNLQPGSEIDSPAANDLPDENPTSTNETPPVITVKVDTKTNMLGVFDRERLVAAYPVTIGSAQTASPMGDWKVQRIVKMPRFRYDEAMLKFGKRSGNFHMLPPGPNSPVGVIWIALNKKGIGLHGTKEPETIGHAFSHGCIRLTNWDVARLAQKVKPGVPVSIH